jgi:2-methylcitrate dehydratase PrpD
MSESHTEPHVSGEELRAALESRARSRPNPVMTAARPADAKPAWEWTTDEQAELVELRESAAALEAQVDELRGEAVRAREREHELQEALRLLSGARMWERRSLVAELAGRGLL